VDESMTVPLTIVIPVLNEVAGIKKTLEQIDIDRLRTAGYDTEVLVIDGGSADGTVDAARKLGTKVLVDYRRGYGRAYKTAFCHARGNIIVTLDGDGSYPSEHIPDLVRLISDNGLDFITTNRFSDSAPMDPIKKLGNSILSVTAQILFSIKLKDSQSGMWIFRRRILKDILPDNDGMSFSQEIKIKAFRRVNKVAEVPIPFRRRIGSQKLRTFRDGMKNLIHLFKLFLASETRARKNRRAL
jgi:glycosyltransferase involved in cell wall biosynthesis